MNEELDKLRASHDKLEKELDKLVNYRNLVWYIANDYHELSYDKALWQRDEWKKLCIALRKDMEYEK